MRKCLNCDGIEPIIIYCPSCGHSETWHNYKFAGKCQCLMDNGESCLCERPDIAKKKKEVSTYNPTYDEWWELFLLKCTCEKPEWN